VKVSLQNHTIQLIEKEDQMIIILAMNVQKNH